MNADSTCAKNAQVEKEGNRQVDRNIPIYNLDMIISVGYRVKSYRGVQFLIRDIRSSEKVFYRKVLEIYALS